MILQVNCFIFLLNLSFNLFIFLMTDKFPFLVTQARQCLDCQTLYKWITVAFMITKMKMIEIFFNNTP